MKIIHLQYVGNVPAKEAKENQVGSKLMWNGGCINEIITEHDGIEVTRYE